MQISNISRIFSFISKKLRDKIAVIQNEEGYVNEEYWR